MAGGREQKKLGKPLRGIQFLEITARYDCLGTFFGKIYRFAFLNGRILSSHFDLVQLFKVVIMGTSLTDGPNGSFPSCDHHAAPK